MMASGGMVLEDLAVIPIGFDGGRHCSAESIMIYLSVPGSSVIPVRVLESDSIAAVKLRVESSNGLAIKNQRLVFDGRELARNDCRVRDYGVHDGNVLHLVIRLSDLRTITVHTACGKTLDFHIERGRNVAYVKQQIAKRGKQLADQNDKLFHDGEELEDGKVIGDISKYSDAIIHLLVRKSAKVRAKPVEKDFELSIVAPEIRENPSSDELRIVARRPPDRDSMVEPIIVNPKIGLSPVIEKLILSTHAGLEKGNAPVMSMEGTGGAYFMQDASGQNYVAVFKPVDEEPLAENNPRGLPMSTNGEGLKRGTRVGEGALREVAAYILDHPSTGQRSFDRDEIGFSGVPPTIMVWCMHSGFNQLERFESAAKSLKIGSLQMFVKNYGTCEDMGPCAFPVEEVHKISVLDIRLANADRHAGNILVTKDGVGRPVLVPIDHGYCLPERFEDCTFEWLYWPQARQPFNSETMNYIKSLDAEEDIALLEFYGWELPLECSRTIRISTMLLKKGAERGLTAFDIGSIMCRETLEKKSKIEEIICEAKDAVLPSTSESAFLETISDIMDHYLDDLTA